MNILNIEVAAGPPNEKHDRFKEPATASGESNVAIELQMNANMKWILARRQADYDHDEYLTGGFLYTRASLAGTDQWTKMKVDDRNGPVRISLLSR